jgi:hypothetical protein
MAHKIADLTLEEVILHLIAGDVLAVTGREEFSLPLPDSRAILVFYNQDRRTYWNPDKDPTIQDGEIDRVLDALDKPPKEVVASLSGNLCVRHNRREGAYYAEQSEEN